VAVRISIRPDGKVVEKSLLTGSGDARTDAAVRKALRRLDRVPPLPRSFRGSVHVQILVLPQ
jgi:TonB family protein